MPEGLDWDLWIGPSPMRPYNPIYLPFNWRAWIDFGAGALGDMGCHVMDAAFSALKLKYPVSVQASHSWEVKQMWTRFDNKETYPSAEIVHYQFPARGKMPPVKLHWYDGGILPERPEDLEAGRSMPESGTIFVGDKGKLICDTYSENPRIFPESQDEGLQAGRAKTLRRVKGGVDGHEQDWISACKGGPAASSNFDYSGPFTETVVMGNLAVLNPEQGAALGRREHEGHQRRAGECLRASRSSARDGPCREDSFIHREVKESSSCQTSHVVNSSKAPLPREPQRHQLPED